jgi:hypothetical protein
VRGWTFAVVAVFATLHVTFASAQEASAKQASQHFQRAVALYGEADYRAALVEFRRAYVLAPNPGVLYNVGETEYQLQDYAAALTTFERFLAETAPGDLHRTEVESDVEVLRARVGHVSVTTSPPGADLTVDDQPAGRTPLERPLLVSIGRRKIVATMAGRPPATRYLDVAADDSLALTIAVPDPATPPTRTESTFHPGAAAAAPESHTGATLRMVGWTTTVALTAGAIVSGILAVRESHDLEAERATFPASPQTLSHDASLTTMYSILADGLAGAAVVVGGATLFSALASGSSSRPAHGAGIRTQVVLGPASATANLIMTF